MAPVSWDRQSTRMRRRYTSEQRTQLVDLVAGGNVTVPEAAAKLGVTSSTAYNWVAEGHKQRRRSTTQRVAGPTFVRLVPSAAADATITVRVGAAEIQVRRGFDGELLQAVVASLVEVAQ
jgi:transposase-like protein